MATNRVLATARNLSVVCSDPTTPASGDPVVVGQIPGVALTDEDAAGYTTIDTAGSYSLPVKAVKTGPANEAIAVGDILYYNTGHTPKLDKDTAGVRFGYALEAVDSGATGTIEVKIGY